MPLTFDTYLTAHLQGDTLELAYLWILTRTDAETHYYTSYQDDVVLGGHTYKARPGLNPFALSGSATGDTDNTEIEGIVVGGDMSELALFQRRYNHAQLEMFIFVYSDLSIPPGKLYEGQVGAVSFANARFRAELRSLAARADQQIGILCSKFCRVIRLGDTGGPFPCRPGEPTWIEDFRTSGTVTTYVNASRFTSTDFGGEPTGRYDTGYLEWVTGENAGLITQVRHNITSTGEIMLAEPMFGVIAPGDTFFADWGCDRRLPTCQTVFDNAINNQGEWYTPGLDAFINVSA